MFNDILAKMMFTLAIMPLICGIRGCQSFFLKQSSCVQVFRMNQGLKRSVLGTHDLSHLKVVCVNVGVW